MTRRAPDDSGLTLIEVVAAMSVLAVFLALFAGATMRLFRIPADLDSLSTAQSQVNTAFDRLDTDVRYASGISVEGSVGGAWYVEYLSTFTGTAVCGELSLTAGGLLQQRHWRQDGTPPAFTAVATNVSASHPFTRYAVVSSDGVPYQRLSVSVSVGPRQITVMFTALNTSAATTSDTVCTEGRPTS